jgi:protein-tyrosine phosphatase
MHPVIDLHSHILPGIDDGPETIAGSLEMARAAVAAGMRTMVATPHVSWRYANTPESIAEAVAGLRERLAAERIELEILAGAEVAMTRVEGLSDGELEALRLGGGPWLLLEPPFAPVAGPLAAIVGDLQDRGHRILLAHPERCPAIHRDPGLLVSLVEQGALSSLTAGSLAGRFGKHVQGFALTLASQGLVHNVASDAHDAVNRAPGVAREIDGAGLGPLSGWLTEEVPRAILSGQDIPERPAFRAERPGRPRPRRFWHRWS